MTNLTIIFLVALAVFLLTMMVVAFFLGSSECTSSLGLKSTADCYVSAIENGLVVQP